LEGMAFSLEVKKLNMHISHLAYGLGQSAKLQK
jgi:hypothetical protein